MCQFLFCSSRRQEENPEFAQDMADIETSIEFLSPTRTQLVWHQDQAGIIPNSCPGSPPRYSDEPLSFHDGSYASNGGGGGIDADREDEGWRRDKVSTGVGGHRALICCNNRS